MVSLKKSYKVKTYWLLVAGLMLFLNGNGQDYVSNYRLSKVVIDAGHGGHDPGATSKNLQEKNVTLAVALKLGKLIETNCPDVEVIYTRQTDIFVPLDERTQIANKAEADLFISIHVNANPSSKPTGAETYIMGLSKSVSNLDVAMRENAVITYEKDYTSKYEGYDPNSAESFIIFSLMQNAYLDQSSDFAALIQKTFSDNAQRKDRGVRQAGFLVLWKTSMPSVLIELGFLSNPEEEKFLRSDEGHNVLASAIFNAFKSYRVQKEQTSRFVTKQQNAEEAKPETAIIPDSCLRFQIQIFATSRLLKPNAADFKTYNNVSILKAGNVYKYTVGNKSTYKEILSLIVEVKKQFPNSFVIAVKNGNQIPLDIAIKQATN
ncbi:N-acetylmuramoyl-L-alanine amidase family protein [Williamwhitmania taraxaci]|nr:N-acetylmuramoyl-L-alanine amidase [Williamwhitmania taraxaci]